MNTDNLSHSSLLGFNNKYLQPAFGNLQISNNRDRRLKYAEEVTDKKKGYMHLPYPFFQSL